MLPPLFAGYFCIHPWTLTSFSVHELIGWYKTIKQAQEGSNTDIPDAFSINGPLRTWIGLPNITTDDSSDSTPDLPQNPSQ